MVDLQRYRATSGKRNFIKQIKVPVFLEAVLAIDIILKALAILSDKTVRRSAVD